MTIDLQTISDHIEINALLNRYASAMDTQNWDVLRTVYTADGEIDYQAVGGPVGDLETVLAWVQSTMPTFPESQHIISNVDVRIDAASPDVAAVEAAYFCQMRTLLGDQFFCGGRYIHRLVRTAEGWRSRHMTDALAWTDRQDEALAALVAAAPA
jgi:3-phenylpropionate/cinnamic acid dioxygenase small subunit